MMDAGMTDSRRLAQGQRFFTGTVFVGLGMSAALAGAPADDGLARGLPKAMRDGRIGARNTSLLHKHAHIRPGDPNMNDPTVTLVRSSWKQVEPIAPDAAALFYSNLFAADPGLRPLFEGDMQQQGHQLMQMIGAAVMRLESE
jgi:Globin